MKKMAKKCNNLMTIAHVIVSEKKKYSEFNN